MNAGPPDVHQTLEYRPDAAFIGLLPVGLFLCFLALFVFALEDRPPTEMLFWGSVLLVVGVGLTGFASWVLVRSRPADPIYVLSPQGVHYRLNSMILIPWSEIRGVDVIDITTFNWSIRHPGTMTFPDVPVVLISKEFYDARLHLDSLFKRGPYWGMRFVEKGPLVQVALHHDTVGVTAKQMRDAVTARWRAFRNQPAQPVPVRRRTSVPVVLAGLKRKFGRGDAADARPPPGIPASKDSKRLSMLDKVVSVAFLIGIVIAGSNLARLWATAGQVAAREERSKWEEQERQRKKEQRELHERLEKTRREIDDAIRRMR